MGRLTTTSSKLSDSMSISDCAMLMLIEMTHSVPICLIASISDEISFLSYVKSPVTSLMV